MRISETRSREEPPQANPSEHENDKNTQQPELRFEMRRAICAEHGVSPVDHSASEFKQYLQTGLDLLVVFVGIWRCSWPNANAQMHRRDVKRVGWLIVPRPKRSTSTVERWVSRLQRVVRPDPLSES